MHRHTLSASKAGGLDRARLPWSAGDSGRDQRQSGLGAWERGRAGRGKSVLRPCGDCVGCRPMGGPRPARAGPPLCMRQVPSTPTPTHTHTHSHSHTHTPHILFGRLCRPLHTPTHPPFRPTWLPRLGGLRSLCLPDPVSRSHNHSVRKLLLGQAAPGRPRACTRVCTIAGGQGRVGGADGDGWSVASFDTPRQVPCTALPCAALSCAAPCTAALTCQFV